MPMYPITYIYIAWHGFITPFSFVGSDCMFFSYCLYITALLKCVQLDITSTLAELTDTDKNSSRCEQKLKLIIERHNEISVLTERFSKIMAITTLSHFVSSSMIIGTSVVAILFLTGIGIVLYVVYAICVTMELFLFCYGGSAVIESSQEVSEEAYCSHWYKRDKNIQKMVLLLMLRAQRPLVVKVPFFAPSLPAFASILRFTGSLIALVKSFL
ncbi:odorant receptor 24a-like [Teleopsis dalmanni]|nr:odorant receptor 24a-like [Teleopsis dalmanni]